MGTTSLLGRWHRLAEIGTVIPCPEMRLDARDWESPIVTGRGEIRVTSLSNFEYHLHGTPDDIGHTLHCLNRLRENPYDGLMRFRLNAVDEEGNQLGAGWTIPNVEPSENGGDWRFAGETESLWVDDPPAAENRTEVLYLLPKQHRARPILRRFVSSHDGDDRAIPEHRMKVLSTLLTFKLDDGADTLTVSAPSSVGLPATYAENWFGEPLRIMFGQLVFPRMVARAIPDRTIISIRPTRRWRQDSEWAAIWKGPTEFSDKDGFWQLYAALLTYVAEARDGSGHPNFETNKVTHLYQEVIQAARGSRWVWALTFASSIEGLIRLIVPHGTKRASANTGGIQALSKHIDDWPGEDAHLKQVARNAVARTAETSAIQALRELRDAGAVTAKQVAAWDKIRNQVMHGSLISPYSSEKDDALLVNLAGLLHALTMHLVLECAKAETR